MGNRNAEHAPVTDAQVRLTRRDFLIGSLLAGAAIPAVYYGWEHHEKVNKDHLRALLSKPRGHDPLFREISDQKEKSMSHLVDGPLADVNLGLRAPDPERIRRDEHGAPIMHQLPPERQIRDSRTGEVLISESAFSDGMVRANPDTFPHADNSRGNARLLERGDVVPITLVYNADNPNTKSELPTTVTRRSYNALVAKEPLDEIEWVDVETKPVMQVPSIAYSETLIEELLHPEVNIVDGQKINAVIANNNPENADGIANIYWGLLGNHVDEGASLLRVAEIAHQNPNSRLYGFDPFAHGGSSGLNEEQKSDLLKGDFHSSVRPFLKLLKEKGETKVRLFGSSLGSTLAITAASIAKEEFGIEVEVVGGYVLPVLDTDKKEVDTEKNDFAGRLLEFGFGSQTGKIMSLNMVESATLDLYHSHPFDSRLMEMEGMDRNKAVQLAHFVTFFAKHAFKDLGFHYAHGLAKITKEDLIALGTKYMEDNKGGNMYIHTGRKDVLSPGHIIDEVADGIRAADESNKKRMTRQIGSGQGHFSLVTPIELGADIARNSMPLAA